MNAGSVTSSERRRVAIAPDSFKGSATAQAAAEALAAGWRMTAPNDSVVLLPQADGGEGTLDALARSLPSLIHRNLVTGPDGRASAARWATYGRNNALALVEMAETSGITKMPQLNPLSATSRGLGEAMAVATRTGHRRIAVALGGSASTDGGLGALQALGARAVDERGKELVPGGGSLQYLHALELDRMIDPPLDGVILLTDVDSPLLGPGGAARRFGPQKGATLDDILVLERGLERLALHLGGDPYAEGSGAAGGTGYGLAVALGASFSKGAATISRLSGLDDAAATIDVLVLGEGRLDESSLSGKVVGNALQLVRDSVDVIVVAGSVDDAVRPRLPPTVKILSLSELSGSVAAALSDPQRWIMHAGALAAGNHDLRRT